MAEGVCFSVLQLFHFPAQDSCVFQNGHCMCPRMVTWPRFAASQQLAESVLQALQKSESHLTLVCALILCQDPVRAQEQWRVGNSSELGVVECHALFRDWVTYQGQKTYLLLARRPPALRGLTDPHSHTHHESC